MQVFNVSVYILTSSTDWFIDSFRETLENFILVEKGHQYESRLYNFVTKLCV